MSALAADRNTPMKDGEIVSYPVAGSTKIYAGALVVANASGYAANASAAGSLTALGRADEQIDNSAGADGALNILVRRKKAFKFANKAGDLVSVALIGKSCYIEDNQTVRATATSSSAAGTVLAIDTDGVWVHIP